MALGGVAVSGRSARQVRPDRAPETGPFRPALRLWCVPHGARIATATAEVPVETLASGDVLLTGDGATAIVSGVEHACASYRADSAGRSGLPLRLRAHALADGIPCQDTTLLADQALRLSDDVTLRLVEVIDGANVVRIAGAAIDWVCLALPTDLPLLVNGLRVLGFPVAEGPIGEAPESVWTEQAWARVGDIAFGGGTIRDFPSGGQWAALRETLADRARASGITTITDPAVHLRLEGGVRVWPRTNSRACRFTLPPGLTSATLVSRSGIPSSYLGVGDDRRLGIAVSAIRVDRRDIPLDHWALRGGWHTAEATWRWTDGAAHILLPHRARELTVAIANPLSAYPL